MYPEQMQQLTPIFPRVLFFLFIIPFTAVWGQPKAPSPAPPGPTNITAILEKAGRFTTLIRLLQGTDTDERINTQLRKDKHSSLTILAPPDSAFSNLGSGTLNSFTDQQKAELVEFHILPTFESISQFQTVSNPISTIAGGNTYGEFPLNVTTTGDQVNITTGFSNASIVNTLYTDDQLAVYEVDKVLLPQKFYVPPLPPPPAPSPAGATLAQKKGAGSSTTRSAASSDAVRVIRGMLFRGSVLSAVLAVAWLFV